MRVLVTGANGHLGFNLVRELLARGHSVRASVRSLKDAAKAGRLRALGQVEVVEVDVYQPTQFRAALEGIDTFFHLAAAYNYVPTPGREESEVVRPSVEGAENAVRAAAETKVPKVVMTSSLVTLPLTKSGAPPSTEEDWNEDLRVPYLRAKTMAERRAWALADELGVNLVTVLPGAICGPGFVRNTPSTDLVDCIMRGYFRMGIPDANFPYVDVRDVVSAHMLAAETPCSGRFIVCNDTLPSLRALNQTMHEIDPSVPLPLMTMPDLMLSAAPLFDRLNHWMLGTPRIATPEFIATTRGRLWNASNARIKRELGWNQSVTLETSLRDTMDTLRANRSHSSPLTESHRSLLPH
jgi:dihydroflavonol-4-reductase